MLKFVINKRLVAFFLMFILVGLVMLTTGCNMPGQIKDNKSIALNIAMDSPTIKDDITTSGGSYSSEVQPADLNVTGYLNYTGNYYRVLIDTANKGRGGSYLEHFNVLVDIDSHRAMQVSRRFDVATYPENILVPCHAAWYHRFPEPTKLASDGVSWSYIEINLSSLNKSIRPVLMDKDNFIRFQQGMPFYAWSFYTLSENATTINIDAYNAPIATGISGITVVPGRIIMPSSSINGHGVKLIFKNPDRHYYFVLINDGFSDVSVESMIID